MKYASLLECGDLSPLSERQEDGAGTSSAGARFGSRPANRANERPRIAARARKRRQVAALQGGFAAWRARRGVSLLEVLISIFVLSIGLLGVAAVIPVAGHEILQATKADDVTSRNRFHDLFLRTVVHIDLLCPYRLLSAVQPSFYAFFHRSRE